MICDIPNWTVLGIYQKNEPVANCGVIYLWPNDYMGNTESPPTNETWTGPFSLSELFMKLFNEKADAK